MTAFIGERISWLMFARNWLFACDAACAASVARTSSVMSTRKPTVWPSGMRRSMTRSTRPLSSRVTRVALPRRRTSMRSATHSSVRPTAAGYCPSAAPARKISSKVLPGRIRLAEVGYSSWHLSLQ